MQIDHNNNNNNRKAEPGYSRIEIFQKKGDIGKLFLGIFFLSP